MLLSNRRAETHTLQCFIYLVNERKNSMYYMKQIYVSAIPRIVPLHNNNILLIHKTLLLHFLLTKVQNGGVAYSSVRSELLQTHVAHYPIAAPMEHELFQRNYVGQQCQNPILHVHIQFSWNSALPNWGQMAYCVSTVDLPGARTGVSLPKASLTSEVTSIHAFL